MWSANSASITAKDSVFYFDLIPCKNLIGFANHMDRSLFNLYEGFGLGFMNTRTEQTKSFSSEMPMRKNLTQGNDYPGHSPDERSGQAI